MLWFVGTSGSAQGRYTYGNEAFTYVQVLRPADEQEVDRSESYTPDLEELQALIAEEASTELPAGELVELQKKKKQN